MLTAKKEGSYLILEVDFGYEPGPTELRDVDQRCERLRAGLFAQ